MANLKTKKKKLQFVLWSLNGGGAERMACYLLNHLDRDQFEIRMTLMRKAGEYLNLVNEADLTAVKNGNQLFAFDDQGNRAIFKPFQLIRAAILAPFLLQREIRSYKPDVVLSFCKGMSIVTMAAVWFFPARKFEWIVREGNNTKAVIDDELSNPILNKCLKLLTYFCFRSADRLLCISSELKEKLSKAPLLKNQRIDFIYNAVDISYVQKQSQEEISNRPQEPYFLAAGRLDRQKAFDVLITAFGRSRAKKDHRLVILGRGPDLESLKELAYTEGVLDRVLFPGFQENPWAWMKSAKAFILSSRWEGFGNVCIEAMACGIPVILSDCSFGPKEILENGRYGILAPVDDVQAFSNAMDGLVFDPDLCKRLSKRSLGRARDFDLSQIISSYSEYLWASSHTSGAKRPQS